MVGGGAAPAHPLFEGGDVQRAVAEFADAPEDFLFFAGAMGFQPCGENGGDGVREAEDGVAGEASARFPRSGEDGG